MSKDYELFAKHLMESQDAVWDVARWLQSKGNSVTVNPTFVTPSHKEWEDYADGGDLFITQRIEVKKLSVNFTCKEDWPFKEKFIVCAKHAWDRALQKPHAFIYLSQDKKHVATLRGETSKSWTHDKRTDKRYENMTQEFYFCDINLVKFMPFRSIQPSS